jgi:hypothetical protein
MQLFGDKTQIDKYRINQILSISITKNIEWSGLFSSSQGALEFIVSRGTIQILSLFGNVSEKFVSGRTFLPLTKKTNCRSALISMSPISPASSGSTAEQHQVSSTAAAALDEEHERKGSAGRQHRHYRTMHRRLLLLRLQNASCTLKNNATKVSFSLSFITIFNPDVFLLRDLLRYLRSTARHGRVRCLASG